MCRTYLFCRLGPLGMLGVALLVALPVQADEKLSKTRSLVDFSDAKSFKLRPANSIGKLVQSGRSATLDITTDADEPYPGVYIEPQTGKWDLTAFDGVEMDVRNPQQVAVRVLLAINNPAPTAASIVTSSRSQCLPMVEPRWSYPSVCGTVIRVTPSTRPTWCRCRCFLTGRAAHITFWSTRFAR